MYRQSSAWVCVLLATPLLAIASCERRDPPPQSGVASPSETGSVVIYPIVHPHFLCVEHPAGQLTALGDALASDCLVADLGGGLPGRFPVFFRGTGERNEDWYGWREPLLAPFDGTVDSVVAPPPRNRPGGPPALVRACSCSAERTRCACSTPTCRKSACASASASAQGRRWREWGTTGRRTSRTRTLVPGAEPSLCRSDLTSLRWGRCPGAARPATRRDAA
jgi:hypothetical protein